MSALDAIHRVPDCASPSAATLIADDGERLLCTYNDARLGADPSWLPLERIPVFDAVMADVRWPEGAAGSTKIKGPEASASGP